jgi:hypothetical protein
MTWRACVDKELIMKNLFQELDFRIKIWENLKQGRRKLGKLENQSSTAYGEVDIMNPQQFYWIHRCYKPLYPEEILLIEQLHNTKFPEQLVQFYLMYSCANLFADHLIIAGFLPQRFTSPGTYFETVESAWKSLGYYQTETGMFIGITRHHYDKLGWIHLDFETGITDLYLRPTGGELILEQSYDSFADFVYSMYDHLEKLFDSGTGLRIGKVIGEP